MKKLFISFLFVLLFSTYAYSGDLWNQGQEFEINYSDYAKIKFVREAGSGNVDLTIHAYSSCTGGYLYIQSPGCGPMIESGPWEGLDGWFFDFLFVKGQTGKLKISLPVFCVAYFQGAIALGPYDAGGNPIADLEKSGSGVGWQTFYGWMFPLDETW